jgi:hypothetical protein
MISYLNKYDFQRAFELAGRKDQFSYDGLTALFEYLEDFEEQTGEQIELDVVALCCDFSEYENAIEFIKDYGCNEDVPEDESEENALEWAKEKTTVIEFDTGIIIQAF